MYKCTLSSLSIPFLFIVANRADPRLLGALRKTVSPAGGVLGGVEGWMKRICPCYTPSRIALAEGARETVSLRGKLSIFFFKQETVWHSRYKIFT